jgi:hypothetical protein
LTIRAGRLCGFFAPVALLHSGAALPADALVVQCTIDSYRSSYAPRPDTFTIQVDLDAGFITTYYGTMPLKMTRRVLRGVGVVSDGWHGSVAIHRNTGRLEAGTDKVDGRKYSYVDLKGTCILPVELQGAGYKSPSGS